MNSLGKMVRCVGIGEMERGLREGNDEGWFIAMIHDLFGGVLRLLSRVRSRT